MWLHTGLHSVRAHSYSRASHHLAVLGRLSQLDLSLYSSYYRLVLNHQWLHKGKRGRWGWETLLSLFLCLFFFLPCYSNLLLSSRSSRYCVKKDWWSGCPWLAPDFRGKDVKSFTVKHAVSCRLFSSWGNFPLFLVCWKTFSPRMDVGFLSNVFSVTIRLVFWVQISDSSKFFPEWLWEFLLTVGDYHLCPKWLGWRPSEGHYFKTEEPWKSVHLECP